MAERKRGLRALARDRRGNASAEYALLAAMISMTVLVGMITMGQRLQALVGDLSQTMQDLGDPDPYWPRPN